MAAIANLALLNAAATSVSYSPEKADGNEAKWVDASAGIQNGFRYVTLRKSLAKDLAKDKTRIRTTNTYPVVDPVTGVTLRLLTAYTEYVISPAATAAERAELYAREKSLQASTVVKEAVETLLLPL